jgi:Kyakuja-Dileera-Zisupton transposase
LSLPDSTMIIPAVGKFHLGAHIRSCFPLFSLNFIHGAGQQDGEILETLWSNLNKVSSSIRAMSKAHRHEVLDDYMRDSNWKKMVGVGEHLRFLWHYILLDY